VVAVRIADEIVQGAALAAALEHPAGMELDELVGELGHDAEAAIAILERDGLLTVRDGRVAPTAGAVRFDRVIP
jgi:hypothetical protein